jgi:hypothetical protein
MIKEAYQLSFHMFIYAFHPKIIFFRWESPLFIPIFIGSVLQYFPFLRVYILNICIHNLSFFRNRIETKRRDIDLYSVLLTN